MRKSVCAVVVTFNRKNLLIECLESLRRQTRPLDAIYLIDNYSTDGTPELLKEKGYIEELPPIKLSEPWEKKFAIENPTNNGKINIYYVRMHENTGGAGGFFEGVKRGYEKGYDWLWLMDDDSEPQTDSLYHLLSYDINSNDVFVLASMAFNHMNQPLCSHRGYFDKNNIMRMIKPVSIIDVMQSNPVEIDLCSFVGFFINRKAVKEIGYPKREFFIYHDDIEYSLRLRKKGRIVLIPKSMIIHKSKEPSNLIIIKILGRNLIFPSYSNLWLTYYGIRNLIWLFRKYGNHRLKFYLAFIKKVCITLSGIIFIPNNRYRRLKFFLSAYIDGFRGVFDNQKPKHILYGKTKNR